MKPEFLTIAELCSALNVKESWVRRKIHYKKIPYYKMGKLIRFSRREIGLWLQTQKKKVPSPNARKYY